MFSFVLQQLISVCIFIGTQQSEIVRGGDSGVLLLGLLAALFLRFLFGASSLPPIPVFSLWESRDCPLVVPSSVGEGSFLSLSGSIERPSFQG